VSKSRDRHAMLIAGARPNFMKIAPVHRELVSAGVKVTLVHTGQHYDAAMSDLFFKQLGIPEPDVNLEVGSASHAVQTAEIMRRFEPVLVERKPDLVVVVGDVNSTAACSLVTKKLKGIGLAHVEAGLRSFDRSMPEEVNRIVTDSLSDILFTSERSGDENLIAEGIPRERIVFVGNVMIDTLKSHLEAARRSGALERHGVESREYVLVTLHRPSNVDTSEVFDPIMDVIAELSSELKVVFPVHPRTKGALDGWAERRGGLPAQITAVPPVGYLEFAHLMSEARLVMTDSGGIQEETTVLGVPCLTLRENTERPVTVSEGTNRIVGQDPAKIREAARQVLASDSAVGRIPEGWDGRAAQRIAQSIKAWDGGVR